MMVTTLVRSMSIFKAAHKILKAVSATHKQLIQLVLAITVLLLLIYFCVLTIFNNQSLNEKLMKVTNERAYVLKIGRAHV